MAPRDGGTFPSAFKPDHFFLSRTEGNGVVRDLAGRVIDRCAITTEGSWDHGHGALSFDEVYRYESGQADRLSWTFAPDAQGRMSASEATITAPVRGWTDGGDYRLRFKRRGGPRAPGNLALTYNVRFTLLEPTLALKVARVGLFGLTLGEITAIHRRVG
jgi:hypothetical protein